MKKLSKKWIEKKNPNCPNFILQCFREINEIMMESNVKKAWHRHYFLIIQSLKKQWCMVTFLGIKKEAMEIQWLTFTLNSLLKISSSTFKLPEKYYLLWIATNSFPFIKAWGQLLKHGLIIHNIISRFEGPTVSKTNHQHETISTNKHKLSRTQANGYSSDQFL